ncbi:YkgJ family cysteine cluster protein [Candidatus Margulisiibacteriota bacterium]
MEADSIGRLYKEIPPAECFKCGSCCKKFKPAFGAAEFVRFSNNPPKKQRGCSFLGKNNLCTVWESRPLACRIFGLEVEHEGKVLSDYSARCAGNIGRRPRISLFEMNALLKEFDRINQKFLTIKGPFYIRALTFDTWKEGYTSRFDRLISAQKLFENGEYQEALLEYTLLRTNNPDDFAIEEVLYDSAVCLEKLGNPEQAREAYETLLVKSLYRNDALADKAQEKLKCLKKIIS